MKTTFLAPTIVALAVFVAAGCQRKTETVAEQPTQAPAATDYVYQQNYPTSESAQKARDDADFQRAVTAYRFWYPAVSMQAILDGNNAIGARMNEVMPIFSAGPRHVVLTANSDTPYGGGSFDLTDRPLVVELPPGAFIALADDHYQTWIMDMGLPGPDAGKGGKHLILPPGYQGTVPKGYYVGHSRSNQVLVAIRSIPTDGNVAAALDALRKIKIYPLSSAADPQLVEFADFTDQDMHGASSAFDQTITFWQKLAEIANVEPAVPEYMPMYGVLRSLGIAKGQPFQPDARMTRILEHAAKAGRAQMMAAAFASERDDIKAWPDRRWEWASLVSDNPHFETPGGMDLDARDRWFIQAIVTSPAMFRRTPGAGSLYWLGCRDATGAYLDGGKTYKLTVPLPVPAKLFWSVTVYDAGTRSEIVTAQNKAALRSLFELKDLTGASVDLYFGPNAPAGQEARWIQTNSGQGWFTYFRIYGPDGPAFDGTWKPGDFEEVK